MPIRTDIRRILLIGSGPIVIGQACEFDYSGTQAARVLKELGYEVVLVNSNPATIMTDPELADATYIEPLTPEILEAILRKERPDALLPTLGGQTALNLSMEMHKSGVLAELGIEMLGASPEAIAKAEDRGLFRACLEKVGVDAPRSFYLHSMAELETARRLIGAPCVLRPAFTLGGSGSALVEHDEDFEAKVEAAHRASPVGEVLVEQSLAGWKEFELEVMRDHRDNVVIVCSIENVDPMGVHTGDSITVAPQQTLTDREYQAMRRAAIDIIREVGVATGGCNIQFAVDPRTGRMVAIEANPRVSRSSALASKATGFPIAKIAAKLAVGLTLDEIPNDITGSTPASYEPSLDYIVVKIPRFTFEKFPGSDPRLGTAMKSVGEVMALGRTFLEAMQKGFRSLERNYEGLDAYHRPYWDKLDLFGQEAALRIPRAERLFYAKYALSDGWKIEQIAALSGFDPWFLRQIARLVQFEQDPTSKSYAEAKQMGYSDLEFARLSGQPLQHKPASFLAVDTCAGEFPAQTPYFYSTHESELGQDDASTLTGRSVLILGSGPNRIGQGIEFDCLCVQASMAFKRKGYASILMNSNPETVSTDYDISSRLYFEPLTLEHVMDVIRREKPMGVVLQLGGQTPLKLAKGLGKHGVPVLGASVDAIDCAEDREKFAILAAELGLCTAPWGMANSLDEALAIAHRVGFPVLVRPSYVLSGSSMRIVGSAEELSEAFPWAYAAGEGKPVLVDRFLTDALEFDVDALCDGEDLRLLGVMEHVEEAGVHSGDSTCFIPPCSIRPEMVEQIRQDLRRVVQRLGVVGFLNAQYALQGEELYLLEINPRASRTAPFLTKAMGINFVELGVDLMLGKRLADLPDWSLDLPYTAVKQVVLPFKKLPGFDPVLGPEMKSTGEAMGMDRERSGAFLKSILASGYQLPLPGKSVYLAVQANEYDALLPLAKRLQQLGFLLMAADATLGFLRDAGLAVQEALPGMEQLRSGKVGLLLHTDRSTGSRLRQEAVQLSIPLVTTLKGGLMFALALERRARGPLQVRSLQEWHRELRSAHS